GNGMKKATAFLFILILTLYLAALVSAAADRLAYITNEGDNNLMVVDLNAEKVMKTVPTGKTPHALAFTKEGKCYVNNRGTRDLTVIDASRFEVIRTLPLPAISFQLALSPDGKTLAVAYKDALELSLIDTAADNITKTIPIGKAPEGVFKGAMMRHPYWSKDGKYIFVIHHKDNVIAVIDTEKREVVKNISVGNGKKQAHAGYFTPDGQYFYMINTEDNVMVKIDVRKMEVVSR